ncbi:MAG TPA: AsmA-like C-terminal region-containing protein [Lacunisphaera sp.]
MSANPQSKPAATVLRFCGSCVVTVLCWAVWLGLGASLVVLIYIAAAHELPVPDFVLRRAEAELARANLTIKFGRASLDPTGKLLLEDVALRSRRFEEPLLTCRLLYLRRDFWSVLAGQPVPDEIRLEGATLQLPAMLSPSGTVEPLIRDLAVVLRHEDRRWLVDQFNGRVGRLILTTQGDFTPPPRAPGAAPLSPDQLIARFLEVSRQLALPLHRLDTFEAPALAVRLESQPGVGNIAHVLLTATAADQPWGRPLSLGPLAATGSLRLDGSEPRPLRLHAAARSARYQADYAVETVRAILTLEISPDGQPPRPREALVAAAKVSAPGLDLLGPVLRADLARWPEVSVATALQAGGEFIAAEVDARLAEESARIRAAGRGSHELINRVLAQVTPRAAPYFVFGDPVTFAAEAVLDPGWRFATLRSRVDAGRLDSRGVKITAARGRIDITGTSFLAHDARVEMGENFARGSYWMDFTTTDYRMLLDGRLRPTEINGWFNGNWWLNFWNARFVFPADPPTAEIDLSGRWRDPARTVYFGSSDARGATVWNGDFEQAHAVVFVRPNFAHGLALAATRAGGQQFLTGTFKRFAEPGTTGVGRFEFDFDTDADPAVLGRMLEGRADEVLASLRFTAPPTVHAWGTVGATANYSFTGAVGRPFHYYGFPLDTARVSGGVTGSDVRLDAIEFTAAGGKGSGKAAVYGPADYRRLGFDLYVNGAELARSIRAVEEYQANRTGEKSASVTESRFMQRAAGGKLDVGLSATGQPGELTTFSGSGNAALTGADLGEIHLFGLLSQVLSAVSLNFSSLKLDAAHSSFRLDGGRLYFPDLKVTGRSAVIDARGNFTLATNALDFTARLKPYEDNRNLITGVIGLVINPITSILELKLTGPISKPDWSIFVGGSSTQPDSVAPAVKISPDPLPPPAPDKAIPPKG